MSGSFAAKRTPRGIRFLAVLLLALIGGAEAIAFTFSFPFQGSSNRDGGSPQGPAPWQYRRQESTNARGTPPGYQPSADGLQPAFGNQQQPGFQMPGYQPPGFGYGQSWPGPYPPSYGQQPRQSFGGQPRLELELDNHQPYVQENVLLKLRVVSDQNLETATPQLPKSNALLLEKLEGPKARSRTGPSGRQEIINEFIYILTPLHSGDVELPPFRVTGSSYGGGYGYGAASGGRFDVSGSEPLRLQVRPAMASMRPWLPLQSLALKATVDGGEEVEKGKPVTLALELQAVGATGGQLPSLEALLRSPDLRVYREQTLTEGRLSKDGQRLEGKRTEYYTLVPSSTGKLKLPEIGLRWWNVEKGAEEYAGLPIRTLQASGEAGSLGPSTSAGAERGLSWLWLLPAGLVLLALGYAGGVWYRGSWVRTSNKEPLRARLGSGLSSAAAAASSRASMLVERVSPAPLLVRLRPLIESWRPPSSRFLACVNRANQEVDPAAWADRFTNLTCAQLKLETQSTLPGMTGRILALRPGADPEQLTRLMQQLDAALYGKQDIDFNRWKKQFRVQVGRRRGVAASGKRRRWTRARLPELNPQAG